MALRIPSAIPLIKSIPHCKARPGRDVINPMADWNPFCTTLPREASAEPIPDTIPRKASTADCLKFPATETTRFFNPFQATTAAEDTTDHKFPIKSRSPDSRIDTWFTSPCTAEPTICPIPVQIAEAACWIFVQICSASSFSFVKFPVTKSISSRTGPSTTFLINSQAPEAAA